MTAWPDARRGLPRIARLITFLVVAAGLTGAILAIVWLSYGAVAEWRGGAERLVEQRSQEVVTLLAVALSRDMKGAHDSVLAPLAASTFERPLYEVVDRFAQAFARFPYPESFFMWRDAPGPEGHTFFFNRVDRLPPWDTDRANHPAFPVAIREDPAAVRDLVGVAHTFADTRRRFTAFEATVDHTRYQVVVNYTHHTFGERRLNGLVGFTVNLDWIGRGYFPDLLSQVARIGGVEDSLTLAVLDGRGRVVASTADAVNPAVLTHTRRFPLTFLDPGIVTNQLPVRAPEEWIAAVGMARDPAAGAVNDAANQTAWLITIAAAAAVLGLMLTLGAVRASTELALMKAEFVSSATHELKTPLAAIQLVADTLEKGRYHSTATIRSYAAALSEQTQLLARLIDNLLVYASLSDVDQRYTFENLAVADVVEKALERFDERLAATGLEVHMEVPRDLPSIRADRQTLTQVLDNVIDNAIKYSPGAQTLTIRGSATGRMVRIDVEDTGIGIPADEQGRVFQKFYRGRAVTTGGTGLGLAIARRVVEDHDGEISIRQREPNGTVVSIAIPFASRRSRLWQSASWWSKTMRRLRAFSKTIWSTKALPSSALRTESRRSRR